MYLDCLFNKSHQITSLYFDSKAKPDELKYVLQRYQLEEATDLGLSYIRSRVEDRSEVKVYKPVNL